MRIRFNFLRILGTKFIEISDKSKSGNNIAVDIDGKYKEYFNQTGLEAVVVRPDFYLFGGTAQLAELPTLVEDLSKQLEKYLNTATAGQEA